jgi:hypothetical protein
MYKLYLLEKVDNEINETEIQSFENESLTFYSKQDAQNYFNNNFDITLSEWNTNYMYESVHLEHYFKIVIKEC